MVPAAQGCRQALGQNLGVELGQVFIIIIIFIISLTPKTVTNSFIVTFNH